jgi:DNA-binding transcriptional LysR family regulator
MRADSPLARKTEVGVQDLLEQPLVGMRSGYLMHRFLHRFLEGHAPSFSFSTDGAEMGKLMVAEGLGVSVLPDFSVVDDPLEQRGVLTMRPLVGDHPDVMLGIQRRRSGSIQQPVRELHDLFVARARAYAEAAA